MQQYRRNDVARTTSTPRPNTLSLLTRILRGTFADGMQLPAVIAIGLMFVLYMENFPYHEVISALLITILAVTGLIRGCSGWQQDLIEYRRDLALSRQRQSVSNGDYTIPGFVPFTRR